MPRSRRHPFQLLLRKGLCTISDWGGIVDLEPAEVERLQSAINCLEPAHPRFSPLRLFRGESKGNLKRQLLGDATWAGDEILYARLFYFGEKAHHFSLDDDRAIARRNWLRGIADARRDTFEWLFDNVHRVAGYQYRRIRKFREDNPEFAAYFGDAGSKSDFLGRVSQCHPIRRPQIRDYYLYFLHTFGRRGVREQSLLVSTSESLPQARRFRDRADDNVILYIFLPALFGRYAVSSHSGGHRSRVVRNAGLPLYRANTGLYPQQREISLRGAVFPQFILGVDDCAQNRFIVNPHLLRMYRDSIPRIARNGIWIDQTGFDLHVRETGYMRYTSVHPPGRYRGHTLGPK
jgi:hypothetical protein